MSGEIPKDTERERTGWIQNQQCVRCLFADDGSRPWSRKRERDMQTWDSVFKELPRSHASVKLPHQEPCITGESAIPIDIS